MCGIYNFLSSIIAKFVKQNFPYSKLFPVVPRGCSRGGMEVVSDITIPNQILSLCRKLSPSKG